MSYFDNKEEVLSIELTPYGRKKLFSGGFRPVFYSFHDDNVIYDITNAQASDELQYSSSIRILEQSIFLKPQRKYDLENTTINDTHTLNNLIGNSSLASDYAPAWSISIIKGAIDSFQEKYIAGEGVSPIFYNIDIPQINLKNIKSTIKYLTADTPKTQDDIIFEDETGFRVIKDFVMIDVSELNVDGESDLFDIEVFEIVPSGSAQEQLLPVYFKKPPQNIVNNILLDENEIPIQILNENLEYADTYFNLLVDQEIDLEAISDEVGAVLVPRIVKPPFGENC
jgi:hypothetical protein